MEHLRKTIGFGVDMCAEVDFRLKPSEGLVLAKALEPFRMFWVEEVFAPEDLAWHETLRKQCSTPIAWGEVAVSQMNGSRSSPIAGLTSCACTFPRAVV